MAVPKKRHSKSRKRTRRSNWKVTLPNLTTCTQCGQKIRAHSACQYCGYYKGNPVLTIKVKKKELETENSEKES
ncbi:50S ribosomal protein L32 [Candidatus Marinamargulisbacteria bacterium SCGC AG-410-N11]|nr:50S ribosomal protein L32 [Candidatus Marinamargulisbacteria bacterium SCGC AG-410-N11]